MQTFQSPYVVDPNYYNHAYFQQQTLCTAPIQSTGYVGAHNLPLDPKIMNYVPFGSPNDVFLNVTNTQENVSRTHHKLDTPRISDIGSYNVLKSSVLKQSQFNIDQIKESIENGDSRTNLNTVKASDLELRRLENQVQNHPNFKSKNF